MTDSEPTLPWLDTGAVESEAQLTPDRAPVIRVLFVINSLGGGGAERSLAEMLAPLVRGGVRPTVACLERAGEGVLDEVLSQGFDVRFLRGGHLPSRVLELRRIIRAEVPDVVHTVIFEANVAGRLAAFGMSATVVTTVANTQYDPARLADPRVARAKLRAIRLIDGWTARHLTDHLHAVSEAAACSACAWLGVPRERITVIERGRDRVRLGEPTPERRRRARRALGLSDADEVIVNVGRQEFQKGQCHLIEAMGRLRDRPRLVMLQAGRKGHVSAALDESVKRARVEGRVRFLGYRHDVPDLLAAADLFVFPSIYEGLGGAVIEAMGLALPIVASDIPALREVIEHDRNGLLVSPADATQLSRAIASLLADQDRMRAFGARSREIFEQRFRLDRSVAGSLALYRRIVAATG
jgi:glycosyltransferase involved in cell wall biosynthesis